MGLLLVILLAGFVLTVVLLAIQQSRQRSPTATPEPPATGPDDRPQAPARRPAHDRWVAIGALIQSQQTGNIQYAVPGLIGEYEGHRVNIYRKTRYDGEDSFRTFTIDFATERYRTDWKIGYFRNWQVYIECREPAYAQCLIDAGIWEEIDRTERPLVDVSHRPRWVSAPVWGPLLEYRGIEGMLTFWVQMPGSTTFPPVELVQNQLALLAAVAALQQRVQTATER